jgi:hypothetical protein
MKLWHAAAAVVGGGLAWKYRDRLKDAGHSALNELSKIPRSLAQKNDLEPEVQNDPLAAPKGKS